MGYFNEIIVPEINVVATQKWSLPLPTISEFLKYIGITNIFLTTKLIISDDDVATFTIFLGRLAKQLRADKYLEKVVKFRPKKVSEMQSKEYYRQYLSICPSVYLRLKCKRCVV